MVSDFFIKVVFDVCADPVFIMACLESRVSYLGVTMNTYHFTSMKEHLVDQVIDRMCTEGSTLYNANCVLSYKNKPKPTSKGAAIKGAAAKGKAAPKGTATPK